MMQQVEKAERLRKKAEKEAQKAARRAQLAQLIVDNSQQLY